MSKYPKVISVHIGARAHYLVPIALVELKTLHLLITDTWIGNKWLRWILKNIPITSMNAMAARYEATIPTASVRSNNLNAILFELKLRFKYTYSWQSTLLRDAYFEQQAIREINKDNEATHVLGLSYTALESFKIARAKGLKTILFQVDPGLHEEELVAKLLAHYNEASAWEPAPHSYWERWKKECEYADAIFVNSQWSKEGLIKQGISIDKISIIPLPFPLAQKHELFSRNYPSQFNAERPLKCLFLGTLALRKGIHLIVEAAKELIDLPIEFIFVGRTEIDIDMLPINCCYKGVVSREAVDAEYQTADLFLFPTFSDGFGLTQLEAMAWQLPVIASKHCGEVVSDHTNGWLMHEITASELVRILTQLLQEPAILQAASKECLPTVQQFSVKQFAQALEDIL